MAAKVSGRVRIAGMASYKELLHETGNRGIAKKKAPPADADGAW